MPDADENDSTDAKEEASDARAEQSFNEEDSKSEGGEEHEQHEERPQQGSSKRKRRWCNRSWIAGSRSRSLEPEEETMMDEDGAQTDDFRSCSFCVYRCNWRRSSQSQARSTNGAERA